MLRANIKEKNNLTYYGQSYTGIGSLPPGGGCWTATDFGTNWLV